MAASRQRIVLSTASALVLGLPVLALSVHAAAVAWAFGRIDPVALGNLTPPAGLEGLSAARCGACHAEIHAEWAASRMGSTLRNPVFLAEYRAQGEPFVCLNCHAPVGNQQPLVVDGLRSIKPLIPSGRPNPDFDPELQAEGVTCVACHLREGALVGPHEVTAPHATRVDDELATERTCARCHQVRITPFSGLERPLPDTHAEWEAWRTITGRTETCLDCHMPAVERPVVAGLPARAGRRHTWQGGWHDDTVRSSVSARMLERSPGRASVELVNLAGHRVPTAEPMRALVVRAVRDGRVLDEQVIARRVPLPRLRDEGDTTLAPAEVRRVDLTWEGDAVVEVVFQRVRFPVPPVPGPHREVVLLRE